MSTTGIIAITALLGFGIYVIFKVFRRPQIDHDDFKRLWRAMLLDEVDFYAHLTPEERI